MKWQPLSGLAAEAEEYAMNYPHVAMVIRSHGGLPDNPGFDPPLPELVQAIVTGTSPMLQALDDISSDET